MPSELKAPVEISASGQILPPAPDGPSGNKKKVRITSYFLVADGPVGIKFQSFASGTGSGTDVSGVMSMVEGVPHDAQHNPKGLVDSLDGEELYLILDAAATVGGFLTYYHV